MKNMINCCHRFKIFFLRIIKSKQNMGFLGGFTTGIVFRVIIATSGIASGAVGMLYPPSAPIMFKVMEGCAAMVMAPPGSNPIENTIVATVATASGPI